MGCFFIFSIIMPIEAFLFLEFIMPVKPREAYDNCKIKLFFKNNSNCRLMYQVILLIQ